MPETRYARSGDVNIAYQVVGEGNLDLVFVFGWILNIRAGMGRAKPGPVSERAALFGVSEGGPMCILFAATYPERTIALVTCGTYAKRIWSPDYPWAPSPEERQQFYDLIEHQWGQELDLDTLAPSMQDDPAMRRWLETYVRRSASPGAALALAKMNTQIDIRNVLPAV